MWLTLLQPPPEPQSPSAQQQLPQYDTLLTLRARPRRLTPHLIASVEQRADAGLLLGFRWDWRGVPEWRLPGSTGWVRGDAQHGRLRRGVRTMVALTLTGEVRRHGEAEVRWRWDYATTVFIVGEGYGGAANAVAMHGSSNRGAIDVAAEVAAMEAGVVGVPATPSEQPPHKAAGVVAGGLHTAQLQLGRVWDTELHGLAVFEEALSLEEIRGMTDLHTHQEVGPAQEANVIDGE